jgi:tetratricopeptide (TPR) repeat protein
MRSAFVLLLGLSEILAQPQAESILKNAITLHQSGDFSGAIRLYQDYLKLRPGSLDAMSNLGAALAHEGRFAEAIAEYNQALKIEPKNPQALVNLALAYYKTGRIADAREKLESARPLLPNNRQVAFLLADCHLRLGEYKKTIALLEPWEKETPDDLALSYLLGTAFIRNQQTEPGSQVIDRILRQGDSAEARLLMATAKLNAHEISGAREDLEKAIELNPQLPEAHAYLGLAAVSAGDFEAAAAAFRSELQIDPYNFTAVSQLGILAKHDQRFDEALSLFERSLTIHPGDRAVEYQIATIELATDKVEAARQRLETLVRGSPQFVEAHVGLATVYYRLKRKEDGDRERAIVRQLTADQESKAEESNKAAGK